MGCLPFLEARRPNQDETPDNLTTSKLAVAESRVPLRKKSDSKTHLLLKMCLLRGGL
jgi:hypothetical protein